MGANASGAKSIDQFHSEFDIVRTERDVRFGDISIYQSIQNPTRFFIAKQKKIEGESGFAQFKSQIAKRKAIAPYNVATIVDTFCKFSLTPVEEKKQLCSSFFDCVLISEYFERSLDQVLRHRMTFQENEIVVRINFTRLCQKMILGTSYSA